MDSMNSRKGYRQVGIKNRVSDWGESGAGVYV